MTKFHITKQGLPAPCRAISRPCPLGGSEVHFNTEKEAQSYVDKQNEKEYQLLPDSKDTQSKPLTPGQIKAKESSERLEKLTSRLGKSWRHSDGTPDEEMIKHCLKNSKYIELGDSFVDVGDSKPTIYKDIWYDDETNPPDLTLESFKEYNLKMGGKKKLSISGRNRDGIGKLRMIPQYSKNQGLELTSLTYEDDDGTPSREITESELVEINEAIDEVNSDYEKRLEKYYAKYKDKISYRGYYRNR